MQLKKEKNFGKICEPQIEIPHLNKGYPATIKGEGIKGIIYRHLNGKIVNNGKRSAVKNIDDFPFPDWDLFDIEKYLKIGNKHGASQAWFFSRKTIAVPINTARGCVFKCTFCHYVFWHDPYRHRSAENIIAEMKLNIKKYNVNFLIFGMNYLFTKLDQQINF